MATYPSDFLPLFFSFVKGGHFLNAISLWTAWVAEITGYVLTALLLYHGIKKYGTKKIMLFFVGSFLYTGIEENVMIWTGTLPSVQAAASIGGTYFFNYDLYFFWFGAVPLVVCCTWFLFAYSAFEIIHYLLNEREGNKWLIIKAILTGFLAMALDLMIDPVYTRLQRWYWLNPASGDGAVLSILSIPWSNFFGWFILIACFAVYWEKICQYIEDKNLSTAKTIGLYVPTLFALELLTVIIVLTMTVILSMTSLWGLNFTIGVI